MFSLFAILLIGGLVGGGLVLFVGRKRHRGPLTDWVGNARPFLLGLVAVAVACLLGWGLAMAVGGT